MNPSNKYNYLKKINYNTLWNNRGKLIQVYPELIEFFKKSTRRGCSNCRKKRIARGILMKIFELPPGGRNLEPLKGVLSAGLLELL